MDSWWQQTKLDHVALMFLKSDSLPGKRLCLYLDLPRVHCSRPCLGYWRSFLWCILTGAYQRTSFLASGRFWRGHLIMKTQVKTSTKRVSIGQNWPNHGTRVEWEYKSSIWWTYLCSGDFERQAFSPFCARVRIWFQWLAAWLSPIQHWAWRHLDCTWEFHNQRRECVR